MDDVSQNPNARTQVSGLAIASLVLSCSSIFIFPLGFLPGIVCGHLARREIRRNPSLSGEGMANAGLIVGYLFLALSIAVGIIFWYVAADFTVVGPDGRLK